MTNSLLWARNALQPAKSSHSFGELLASSGRYDWTVAPGQLDMVGMATLPANHILVDALFQHEPLSSTVNAWGFQSVGFVLDPNPTLLDYEVISNYIVINQVLDLTVNESWRMAPWNSTQRKFVSVPLPYDIWIGAWWIQPQTVSNFVPGKISLDAYYRPAEGIDW